MRLNKRKLTKKLLVSALATILTLGGVVAGNLTLQARQIDSYETLKKVASEARLENSEMSIHIGYVEIDPTSGLVHNTFVYVTRLPQIVVQNIFASNINLEPFKISDTISYSHSFSRPIHHFEIESPLENFRNNMQTKTETIGFHLENRVYDNLGISKEEFSFDKVPAFPHLKDGMHWRVYIKDINNYVITSLYISNSTYEIFEIIPVVLPEYFIEVEGMSILLQNNTSLLSETNPQINTEILDSNIGIEKAGKKAALAVYDEFNIDLHDSRIRLIFSHVMHEEIQIWNAFLYVYPNYERNILRREEFHVSLDATTGEVLRISRGPFTG